MHEIFNLSLKEEASIRKIIRTKTIIYRVNFHRLINNINCQRNLAIRLTRPK